MMRQGTVLAEQVAPALALMSPAVQASARASRGEAKPAASTIRAARRSADPRLLVGTGKENVTNPLALLHAPCAEGRRRLPTPDSGRTHTPAVSIPASQKTVRPGALAEKGRSAATFAPGRDARACRNASPCGPFSTSASPPG